MLQYRDCDGLVGKTIIHKRDTVVYRDTQYIPIPRYINKVRVVQSHDTIFVRDTTARGDTLTVAIPKDLDSATVDIRYAPEKKYIDTILVRDVQLSQGPPWWQYVLTALLGLVVGFLLR